VKTETIMEPTPKIRTVFMGTPEFAEPILSALLERAYHIVAVYTRPDKPQGRNQSVRESPIKQRAEASRIAVEQPETFDAEAIEKLRAYRPDLIIVAAYGKILPASVLAVPGFGCINVHPSLLPKYRGPSPIQNAILAGETVTGTSVMLLDRGMDSGDILAQERLEMETDEMFPALSRRLAALSGTLLVETLPKWIGRSLQPQPQDASRATLCQLIEREDGHILWSDDAASIYNTFRALSLWPGAYVFWNRREEQLLRIKLVRIARREHAPSDEHHHLGEVFLSGVDVVVQTSSGVIVLEEVQMEGKTILSIEAFVRGYPNIIGSVLC
jgi:methionyl-tRNA formyltransferase